MTNRRVTSKASSSRHQRSRQSKQSARMRRKLQMEFLEERRLLAVGPRLVEVVPNVGDPIEPGDVLHQAPRELKLAFSPTAPVDPATIASGIQLFKSDSTQITPDFAGLGISPNEVFLRFSEALPDDDYQLQIVGTGNTPLRGLDGTPFGDTIDDGVDAGVNQTIDFQLQLGAQIVSVVPQPITRDATTGALTQAENQIDVYFNDDQLDADFANKPAYYRLIDTSDQSLMFPDTVVYDAVANKATLTFSAPLPTATYQLQIGATEESNDTIADATELGTIVQQPAPFRHVGFIGDGLDPAMARANDTDLYRFDLLDGGTITIDATPTAGLDAVLRLFDAGGTELTSVNAAGNGGAETLMHSPATGGTFYLGVSSTGNTTYDPATGTGAVGGTTTGSYALDVQFNVALTVDDNNSSFDTATPVGPLGLAGTTIDSQIRSPGLSMRMPGGIDEPGHRDIPPETHLNGGPGLGLPATKVARYNFQDVVGVLPSGSLAFNSITENQKDRAREIFEIYSRLGGIQFIETANEGMTIATADLRALDPTIQSGPGGVAGLAGGGLTGTAIMDAAENWGSSLYGGSWFEVAMHEIGHLLSLGHSYDLPDLTVQGGGFGNSNVEAVFPGDHDIVHLRFIHPPASKDLDLYEFTLNEPGTFVAETIAERLTPNSSTLDTTLMLYQETAPGVRELIATNDDYYSNDSYLEMSLPAGRYFIGVSAALNREIDPAISDTGFGGTSEGNYQLQLDFTPTPQSSLIDVDGIALDGDTDGVGGGLFNFYFETGYTIFVDKLADVTPGVDGDGSLASPLDTIQAATEISRATLVMPTGGGDDVVDGESFLVDDGVNPPVTFEFNSVGGVGLGAIAIPFTAATSRNDLATAVANAIDGVAALSVTTTVSGPTVRINGSALVDASGSPTLINTPSIIRILGNSGADQDPATLGDNVPYLVGFDDNGVTLPDGPTVSVPQGVTVMIDAGALFKLQKANLDVGSSAQRIDRSGGALQVLGTPEDQVSFYSFRNDTVGGDSNGPGPSASPGDWGGIVFREDSDYEDRGIFLNWVNNATIVSGGGKVVVESVEEQFAPIFMTMSRPTISFNEILRSADAAMSADPASFEDSGNRIGPDIQGNRLTQNSLNGLFVRIRTELGRVIDRVSIPTRWDDTDIVHILTENLLIEGTPGGPMKNPLTGNIDARLDGSVKIDPGMIVKLEGSRIEAMIGGQLLAEGTGSHDVIFTALNDDEYGASGSFDTKNDGNNTAPAAGQWGGLFFNTTSRGSIDHALIAYAGGLTPIEGSLDNFNAVGILQADVRIANSLIRDNAAGTASTNRNGRGGNAPATVFVRGAQPILVNNAFVDNLGTVVHINANAMQAVNLPDVGRQTGWIDRFSEFDDNFGPLVRDNRLQNNSFNGMEVRPATLTTASVWDDTDIVHILRDEIIVLNHHTFSGLRLNSAPDESLVVKLSGPNAGFTANGTLLDIDDRIGGSLYIGGAGEPVVITSLSDDTAAAGVNFFGQPVGDTDNNGATTGSPGDYRGIRIDRYSNDRNVLLVRETEPTLGGAIDLNATPQSAQFLGNLAPNEKSGDVNRRLGFEVHGYVSLTDPSDVDTYSFDGVAGTEVFLDIDLTSAALDPLLELVDANGTVIARSIDRNVANLSGSAMPLLKEFHLGDDYYSIDPRDPAMRVTLPGVAGETNTYFVRVRSNPAPGSIENINGGLTSGDYRLQIRLQQRDEVPGSFVEGADIRFATNGIEVLGMPAHSPLTGESTEKRDFNNTRNLAQPLGNLLTTDRSTLSVGGEISSPTDIDWYEFQVDYEFIQSIGGVNNGDKSWATVFDIDYADGLARADTVVSVFDTDGTLILVSRDSNIEDDQPAVGQGADLDDLSRGSVGTLDPFLGTVQLPAGGTRTYYVAVSSNAQLPVALNGTFTTDASSRLVRLEPVDSIQRIAEDHIGFQGYTTGNFNAAAIVNPTTPLFDISDSISLQTNVVPFTLNDVVLYTARPGNRGLQTANAFTGDIWNSVADLPNNTPVTDVVMRSDGTLWTYESIFGNAGQNTAGRLVRIDPSTGQQTVVGQDNIPDFNPATNPPDPQQLTSSAVNAFAWQRTGVNNPRYNLYYAVENAVRGGAVVGNTSTLYRANDANGSAAAVQNQPWGVRGEIYDTVPGDLGVTTGMAFVDGRLYGVSDAGFFYQISTFSGRASNVVNLGLNFSGLTEGPQNLEGGRFSDILFASTRTGQIIAIDTAGNLQSEFSTGTSSQLGSFFSEGIAFSVLDFNLWHPTLQRRSDPGHGINEAFDESRKPDIANRSINGRNVTEAEGGASFYFGLETWVQNPTNNRYFTYDGENAQYGILRTETHQDLSTNNVQNDTYDLPGGAFGSLQTNPVNLAAYTRGDKPTIYFNYYLDTEGQNDINDNDMRDSARVLASRDGGITWELLATNNSIRSSAFDSGELPRFTSASVPGSSTDPRQQVQELFDDGANNTSNGWRQARVDLSNYAGEPNLLFRFDFSTAGALPDQGGDVSINGDLFDEKRNQDNRHEGFYVDDIIIGFAERGEMATDSPNSDSAFFQVPQNPNPADPKEVLQGAYQLEVRRGTEYTAVIDDLNPDVIHFQLLDTNDRLVREEFRLGDRNLPRDQGQILIANNTVTDALQYGIVADAGQRDIGGSLPHPGGVRQLPTLNNARLTTGVKIENNVVSAFGTGGILFSGDPNAGTDPLAPVPFGRIMNNTVYGGESPNGVGIEVSENASPTILNNIVANTVTGISIDGTSNTTIVAANLFSGNTANGSAGQNAILLNAGDPLFVDPTNKNFYLAQGSLAIDSSLNSLADRPNFQAVNSPLGIPPSPILAPDRDRFRQLRVDDPSQDPPPGLGSNIFKDRGAIERADFVRPFVELVNPEDNDAFGNDLDPAQTFVLVNDPVLDDIRIRVLDTGVGVDQTSIVPATVSVTFDGTPLVEGVDYDFVFFANGNFISLQNLPDNPEGRSTYEVTLDNSASGIVDLAGNPLANNRPDGSTAFTIVTGVAPEAIDDTVDVDEDSFVVIDVLANDVQVGGSAFDASTLMVTIVPMNGFAEVIGGQIRYTPDPDYFGPDQFGYRFEDVDGRLSNTGTVFINVLPVNDPPVGVNDPDAGAMIQFLEDDPMVEISWDLLLANDMAGPPNETGQILSITGVNALNADPGVDVDITVMNDVANRVVKVTPGIDQNGIAKFSYFVQDDQATDNTSLAPATVTLEFLAVNDPPVADPNQHIVRDYNVDEDPLELMPPAPLQIDVTELEALDAPGPITAIDELVSQRVQFVDVVGTSDQGGTVTYDAVTRTIEYVPAQNFFGTDLIFYTLADLNLDGSTPISHVQNPDGSFSRADTSETATGTITVRVNPRNDAPDFTSTALEGLEDTTTVSQDLISLLGITGGPMENDPVMITLDTQAANGTASVLFDATSGRYDLQYQPNEDFFGQDTLVLALTDDALVPVTPLTTLLTATVTVRPINDAPLGVDDQINLIEGQPRVVPTALLLGNDAAADIAATGTDETSTAAGNRPQSLQVTAIDFAPGSPAGGSVQLSADGLSVTIIPPPNYYSTDGDGNQVAPDLEFVYTLQDNGLSYDLPTNNTPSAPRDDFMSATGTLHATVFPTNNPPVASPHQVLGTVLEDTPFTIPVTSLIPTNDLVNGLPVGDSIPPQFDSAGPGEDLGPNGIKDPGETLTQILKVESPVPGLSRVSTTLGGTVDFVTDPVSGDVVDLVYTPPVNFASVPNTLLDSFNYRLVDNGRSFRLDASGNPVEIPNAQQSALGRVEIEVLPLNDRPIFNLLSVLVTRAEDSGQTQLPGFASRIAAGPISAVDEIDPVTGQSVMFSLVPLTFPPAQTSEFFSEPPTITPDGTLSFTPADDAFGTFRFEVTLIDDGPNDPARGEFNTSTPITLTLDILPVNDPPTFTPGQPINIDEDNGPFSQIWAADISVGPANESSQTLLFEVVTPDDDLGLFDPGRTPSILPDGTLQFTTAPNANGETTVQVTAVDSEGGRSQTVDLTITVNEVNDTPIAQSEQFTTDEDRIFTIPSASLLANEIDPDLITNPSEVLAVVMPLESFSLAGARVTFDPVSGDVTYDPTASPALQSLAPGETLIDSFPYSVRDAAGATSNTITASLIVDGVNDVPITREDAPQLGAVGTTNIRVLDNDEDVDGTIVPSSVRIEIQPAFGTAVVLPDGSIDYTPFTTANVDDVMAYSVADNLGGRSASTLVTISANASPIARNDSVLTYLDEPIVVNVIANDTDPDGAIDPASLQITRQPTRGEVFARPDGTVQYIPDSGFLGRDSFEYRVADNQGRLSNPARVDTQVVASRLQNPTNNLDVDDNGFVTARDALLVINLLELFNSASIPVTPDSVGPPYYDVNGNLLVTVADALAVVIGLTLQDVASPEQVVAPIAPVTASSDAYADSAESPLTTPIDDIAGPEKIVDVPGYDPIGDDLVDLIASDQDDDDEDDPIAAIDAAMADIL